MNTKIADTEFTDLIKIIHRTHKNKPIIIKKKVTLNKFTKICPQKSLLKNRLNVESVNI